MDIVRNIFVSFARSLQIGLLWFLEYSELEKVLFFFMKRKTDWVEWTRFAIVEIGSNHLAGLAGFNQLLHRITQVTLYDVEKLRL